MKYLLGLIVVLLSCTPKTQKLTSAHLKMEVTDISSTMGNNEQMEQMIKGLGLDIYFDQNIQVTDVNMMNGARTMMFFEDSSVEQYTEIAGQKLLIKMNTDEWKTFGMTDPNESIKITYDKSEIKEVLGYPCYKANMDIKLPTIEGVPSLSMKMEAYITENIVLKHQGLQQLKGVKLNGTPLQIKMDMGVMTMTYEATSINKDFDKSIFNKPQSGYKEISLDELAQLSVNGMGL